MGRGASDIARIIPTGTETGEWAAYTRIGPRITRHGFRTRIARIGASPIRAIRVLNPCLVIRGPIRVYAAHSPVSVPVGIIRAMSDAPRPIDRQLSANGLNFHYLERGPEDAPP